VLSGPDAPMLLVTTVVKKLLGLARSLASQPSSQETMTAPATFSRATTALNSQVGGGAPAIKSEPSQTDHLQPVPLDPNLFNPRHHDTLAHDNNPHNPHVDNTYGMAAIAAAVYTPDSGAAPAFIANPMTIDSSKPGSSCSYLTDLGISPSPEPEQQAGPSRPPRRKRKTPTSLNASSRSGSLDSAMTLDSPTFNGWRVGF